MQSPSLPIQLTSASPAPAASRNQGGGADGAAQFSQALSREMDQRQPVPKAAAPAKVNAPAKPEKPQAQAKADSAAPAKTDTPPATAKADGADSADAKPADDSTAAADPAAGTNPLFDMLAMVASLNPAPAIAVPAQAAASADPAQAGAASERPGVDLTPAVGLGTATSAAAPMAGQAVATAAVAKASPDATSTVFDKLMARADGAKPEGLEKAAAALAEPRAVPALAAQGIPQAHAALTEPVRTDTAATAKAAPAQPGAANAVQAGAAPTAAREALPEPLALKDMPAAAPALSPLQQATLAPLQTADAVHGADRIAARVGTPGWDNQVAQKIIWMVAGKEQSATLTLNPPDMGPMQVVLSVNNDQATVTFSAAQPEVRQALQDAMPKLRDMMGESGIALGNASVHDGSGGGQQQAQGEAGRSGHAAGHASGSAREAEARVTARPARRGELPGLVDTFA